MLVDYQQIIYVSKVEQSHCDFDAILNIALQNNHANNICGLLAYAHNTFAQIIEGHTQHIATLFDKIKSDSRHHSIQLINHSAITRRIFADWDMTLVNLDDKPQELSYFSQKYQVTKSDTYYPFPQEPRLLFSLLHDLKCSIPITDKQNTRARINK